MTISESKKANPYGLTRPRAVLFTTLAALLTNLVLWLVGLAVGGSFELTDAGKTMSVAPGGVVIFTVLPVVVGTGLTALISLKWLGVIPVAQVVGVLAPLGTIALTVAADFDTVSTVMLSLMHVAIAVVVPVGLEAMRRGAVTRAV